MKIQIVAIFLFAAAITAMAQYSTVPEGYMIIEGDIVVPENFYRLRSTFGDTTFWPNGIVPYEFDANVSAANESLMLAAMQLWEDVAAVNFIVRDGQSDYVHIQNSTLNNSSVGMIGGEQVINISSWTLMTMAHELGHALGLWHEQSRPDRDTYVTINWENIQTGKAHNFNKRAAADVYPKGAYNLPDDQTYDYDSAMHYGQNSFSSNGQNTITVNSPNEAWQTLIGQRTHLSDLDILTMSFIYPEAKWRFVDGTSFTVQLGTFLTPFHTFIAGYNSTPAMGHLWIQPGSYSAVGIYDDRPMLISAPLGNVILK